MRLVRCSDGFDQHRVLVWGCRADRCDRRGYLPCCEALVALKHTPRSLPWQIVAVIDTERQRQATLFQDQQGPVRESTARRVFELSRLLRQAINGSVR